MRERWTDHGLRSLAALFVVVMAAMVPAGAVQSQDKKPIVIAVPVGLSGVNSVVAPAVVQSGELAVRSEEHTSELQSQFHLVCRLLLEKKKKKKKKTRKYVKIRTHI